MSENRRGSVCGKERLERLLLIPTEAFMGHGAFESV